MACTTGPSHLEVTSRATGAAARRVEGLKLRRYRDLAPRYIVTPVAFETTGVAGPLTSAFITELGRRITSVTGEPRETEYLWQRLPIAAQRGNAAAILLGAQRAADESLRSRVFLIDFML